MRFIILLFNMLFIWAICMPNALAENLCMYLSGFWAGSYTYLHHRDCREYNGCTHLASGEVTFISHGQYQVDLTLQRGERVLANFSCENSTISIPSKPNSINELTCANGACFVKYQDDKVSATVIHVVS